jgi:RimJ/RimL family protein N-acetyltransferase
MLIRPITADDAEAFWQMQNELDKETKFMMYEPGERSKNIDLINSIIRQATEGDDLLLVAENIYENENSNTKEIVGYISAQKGTLRRIRHSAYIVVGIRKAFQGQGIGTQFFKELQKWAEQKGVTRLELTVMCPNTAARHLYEKNGFVIEGIKKNSMLVDGCYTDEYYMAKLL